MKKDKYKTEVIFLMGKPEGDLPCNVFAFFPKENYYSKDYGAGTKENWEDKKTSYAHIGQHSACHIDYAKECKEATESEYSDLKRELESIGYNLKIVGNK